MRRILVAAAALAALSAVAVVVLPLLVLTALMGSARDAAACTGQPEATPVGGGQRAGVGDLDPTQLGHVATIVAVGQRRQVPAQGIVVALAVVAQESGFRNYANDGVVQHDATGRPDLTAEQADVAASLRFPHDAVGSDHGSLGLAQQQYPWWGSVAELMDPATAIDRFYTALLAVPGWASLPVTQAAQAVQRSAFPDAYADDEPLARELLAHLTDAGAGLGGGLCGSGSALQCAPTGLAVEDGLTPDALRVLRCVQQHFGDHTYAGVGERPDNPDSDHPTGRAVDVTIEGWDTPPGNGHGWRIATWVAEHAAGLGVANVIFDARIWSTTRAGEGWRPYTHPSGRGGPTAEHRDHVHVSALGNAAGGGVTAAAGWTAPISPGTYTLTSGYGARRDPTGTGSDFHTGLDFAAPARTPIRAAAAGTVTFAGARSGYGNLVVIDHGQVDTYYAHQVDGGITVTPGQPVTGGQVIGAVGSTGRSTGNHLHFEVRVNGTGTDPVLFLAQYGVDPGTPR